MPGMDGLEAARHLLRMDNAPASSSSPPTTSALEAFEVQALTICSKPVRRERLLAALQRAKPLDAVKVVASRGARRFFSVSERGRLILVPADDVIFFRAERNTLPWSLQRVNI